MGSLWEFFRGTEINRGDVDVRMSEHGRQVKGGRDGQRIKICKKKS